MSGQSLVDPAAAPAGPLHLYGRPGVPVERLVLAHSLYHPRSEQIRMLRTELLLRHEEGDGANVIAVLSPCGQEGR